MPAFKVQSLAIYVVAYKRAAAFAVVTFGLLLPLTVWARPATHDEIVNAMNVMVGRSVGKLGVCTEQKQNFGDDCVKTTQQCSDAAWTNDVVETYTIAGPIVMAKAGITLTQTSVLEYLNADPANNFKKAPGPVYRGTCYCQCPENAAFEPCKGKPQGTPFRTAEDTTYEQCVVKCGANGMAQKCAGSLPPVSQQTTAAGEAAAIATFNADMTCFRPDECAGQSGIFEAYDKCPGGKGRCFAAEPEIALNVHIGNITKIQGLNNYIVAVYRYLISVGAVGATIAFVFGAFQYLLGSALPQIKRGREYMVDAVIGLLLILGANMILRTINPATTTLNPIKVFMINTVQFASAAFCSDMGNAKLALAGVKPSLKPYAEVAKDPKAFSVQSKQAECGKAYWMENAVGSACEGSACSEPGEACVSCSDALPTACVGVQSEKRVCDKLLFGGTINFIDKRYSTGIALIMVCNAAQNTDVGIVYDNIARFSNMKPVRTSRQTGQGKTDEDEIGMSSYRFEYSANQLNVAINDFCKDKGGFHGALIGVVYHEPLGVNDVAVLSKRNCGSGNFDGLAPGSSVIMYAHPVTALVAAKTGAGSDLKDYAQAIAFGVKAGNFMDDPNKTNYWSAQELQQTLNGQPITCNFSLSKSNAPSL